ncbi:hypothetical protein ACQP2X_30265 [Actinoplanes sp. CA-131856]
MNTTAQEIIVLTQSPNWADKLEAWSTFAGVIMSLLAFSVAALLLRFEIRRGRQAEDAVGVEQSRAQEDRDRWEHERRMTDQQYARAVIAEDQFRGFEIIKGRRRFVVRFRLRNFGPLPLLAYNILFREVNGRLWLAWHQYVVDPGADIAFAEDWSPDEEQDILERANWVHMFTDAYGRTWKFEGVELTRIENEHELLSGVRHFRALVPRI